MIDEKKLIQNYIDKLESHGMQFEAMKWVHTAEFMYELAEYFKSKVDAPDINVGTKWIPCSERLPEKYGEYLCCDNCGNVIIAMPFENRDSDTRYCAESDNCYMWSCTAWMPLPPPYKVGD